MDAENRTPSQEAFDRWVDTALRARADAEPRVGLENRVLARLRAEPEPRRFAWWALPIAAVAVLVIAVVLVSLYRSQQERTIANRQQPRSSSQSSQQEPAVQGRPATVAEKPGGHRYSRAATTLLATRTPDEGVRHSRLHSNARREGEPLPKLAAFPAPRPETAEERMLLRLAARRGSYDLASSSTDAAPLKDLSVPEIKIDPMEGTPPDNTPRE